MLPYRFAPLVELASGTKLDTGGTNLSSEAVGSLSQTTDAVLQ